MSQNSNSSKEHSKPGAKRYSFKLQKVHSKLKKSLQKIAKSPVMMVGIFAVVGLSTLLLSYAFTVPTKGVSVSLTNCSTSVRCTSGTVAANSALAFNGTPTIPGVQPPVTAGGALLPNTLELSKYKMNAKADVANPPQVAGENILLGSYSTPGENNGEGQFRIYCKYSHFNYDDPIVYPPINGVPQTGKAHLHMYWGNTRVNASTTKASLTTSGGGSCNGNELNRTAYWMPALNDGNGNVVIPKALVMYYKSKQTSVVSRMPQGLKMIAGNSNGNTTQTGFHNMVEWNCYDGSATWSYPNDAYGNRSGTTIPASCPDGQDLNSLVYFQQCWNGTGLETTDVAFANNGQCPSGWKTMPQVSYHVFWPKSPTGSYANWYLSSDRMNGTVKPNGSTLHGDWFGGWNDSIMDEWINNCIRAGRNCGNGRLGDGNRTLKTFYPTDYEGPTHFLPRP